MGLLRSKKSFAMEIATKPLVMPSEIAGLEPLHGYIKQGNRVVPARLPYLKPKVKQPGFVERSVSISPRPIIAQQEAPSARLIKTTATAEPPKKPVKKQSIFPGVSQRKTVNEESKTWDESEWIE
jgi:hypothetical protein